MIIKLLRSKDPARQILLFLLVALPAILPAYSRGVVIHQPEDSSAIYLMLVEWLKLLPEQIQFILLLLTILWVMLGTSRFCRRSGGYRGRMVIPLFIAMLVIMAFPQSIGFSPLLIAMIPLIPAMGFIMRAASNKAQGVSIFNAGLLFSIATLIAFPILLFIPTFFTALFVFRLYKWNYLAMLVTGVVIPWFYLLVFSWVFDTWSGMPLSTIISYYTTEVQSFFFYVETRIAISHYPVLLLVGVVSFAAITTVYSRLDQRVLAVRYLFRALLWFLLPIVMVVIVSGSSFPESLAITVCFIPLVLSEYLQTVQRERFANIIMVTLILSIIAGHLYPLIS